jgi:hypothetical protein
MITPKIKALFQFIEFLYSNIENFKSNHKVIKELELLNEERQKAKHKRTFKDKLKYDEVQTEIETKFKILQDTTANLIKAKAIELNVCNFDKEPLYNWYGIETDIHELKENFSKSDLTEIFEFKTKYIDYRTNSHKSFFSLGLFFDQLDELLKELFDYFKETEKDEFEVFETKTIEVNNLKDAVGLLIDGNSKISINPKIEPKMNDEYNDMFAVSSIKAKFVLSNGSIQHVMHTTKGTFDLENANIYDKETGEIVKKGTRTNYNTEFLIRLNRLYILEVKPFLNHHLTNSNNRQEFFDYVKYAALNTEIIKHEGKKAAIQDWVNGVETPLNSVHKSIAKPELIVKQISFSSPEIIEKLHTVLKGYFLNKESELLKVFQGEALTEKLLFPHNQNKFVELFKRVKYNGYLLNTPTEIRDWICSNFCFRFKKGTVEETRDFNQNSVWDILTKDKDPAKKERICNLEWLPYKSHLNRQREVEKENL